MLTAKGDIVFTLEGNSYTASNQFRVAFSFGDNLLFSGTIKSDHKQYKQGESYQVDIEFFTIEDEAYELIKAKLQCELNSVMCAGSRIIGLARLSDFVYNSQSVAASA
jgi:hypothetical protein